MGSLDDKTQRRILDLGRAARALEDTLMKRLGEQEQAILMRLRCVRLEMLIAIDHLSEEDEEERIDGIARTLLADVDLSGLDPVGGVVASTVALIWLPPAPEANTAPPVRRSRMINLYCLCCGAMLRGRQKKYCCAACRKRRNPDNPGSGVVGSET